MFFPDEHITGEYKKQDWKKFKDQFLEKYWLWIRGSDGGVDPEKKREIKELFFKLEIIPAGTLGDRIWKSKVVVKGTQRPALSVFSIRNDILKGKGNLKRFKEHERASKKLRLSESDEIEE